MLITQGGAYFAVSRVSQDSARKQIDRDLVSTARIFRNTLVRQGRDLLEKARLLSSDFAFKQAFASRDYGTMLSALQNHRIRMQADVMMLCTLDGHILTDTLHPDDNDDSDGSFPVPGLFDRIMDSETGELQAIGQIDDAVYQLAIVPLFTPEPSAFIVIGFLIDENFARELSATARDTEVSLLQKRQSSGWQLFATTLPPTLASDLSGRADISTLPSDQTRMITQAGQQYISMAVPFGSGARPGIALLQRSLDQQLSAYRALSRVLLGIFLLSLLMSLAAAWFMARSVVRPVKILERGARKIAAGDFGHRVQIRQQDELGQLADTFNEMGSGLAERDRVRNLLGKVVSPEIAEELLSRQIELGGEEREVTVLFSDIRNFTGLCEKLAPGDVVRLLNSWFTRANEVIERHGGVVDKYIGDAVMALFGAPLDKPGAAARAVGAGLDLQQAIRQMNKGLITAGTPSLNIGIGIHTSQVLAGNMGSASRLNYTVIGDGVNLASRLESLCKYYGVESIVSEDTRRQAPAYAYRELDRVCVKGRQQPVTIYQPLGPDPAADSSLPLYRQALDAYRNRQWQRAIQLFTALAEAAPTERLYQLYLERTQALAKHPPDTGWNGVFQHAQK